MAVTITSYEADHNVRGAVVSNITIAAQELVNTVIANYIKTGVTFPLGVQTGTINISINDTVHGATHFFAVTLSVTETDGSYNAAQAVVC
jgi:hypothetical protein